MRPPRAGPPAPRAAAVVRGPPGPPRAVCPRPAQDPAAAAAAARYRKESQRLLQHAGLQCPLPNGWRLYAHQHRAARRCIVARRLILALEMGLGKTVISLAAARAHTRAFGRRVVVLCPASVASVWRREAERVGLADPRVLFCCSWAQVPSGDGVVRHFREQDEERGGAAVAWDYATGALASSTREGEGAEDEPPVKRVRRGSGKNGATAPAGSAEAPPPGNALPDPSPALVDDFTLVADEAHYMQNYASARTRAALALARDPRCKVRCTE